MTWPILTVAIATEGDLVFVRQRARRTAELLGLATQDQTRIATAVSEIARNALGYASGGRAEFLVEDASPDQNLVVRIVDKGGGIADLPAVLGGRYRSAHGLGLGIQGARRLMDNFEIQSSASGTSIVLKKSLPRRTRATSLKIAEIVGLLSQDPLADSASEMREQNQALLQALALNEQRQQELQSVNAELEKTNRGVVALYGELDRRAEELKALNGSLEIRIEEAVAERNLSEEHFRQAQKMEALGQLTGGVAHDFNNLLQVIVGNLEIVRRQLPEDAERPRRSVANALEGAKRASVLTSRLLAFARRQPLKPQTIDVDGLTRGMFDLLRRTLGEQLDVKVAVDEGLWPVQADPHQLENAIVNLAVNARHAMPEAGRVTIKASNIDAASAEGVPELSAGEYVAVCVTDTGTGMSPEVLAHVFEPFFTTKAVGQGTGLGLSQVYGFAKQSGGDVKIESSLGKGTTVTIYLPRSADRPEKVSTSSTAAPTGGVETILVVEDNEDVRNYTVEALGELGYAVVSAEHGEQALAILRERPEVRLLFTDVVLTGGMNGRDLARLANARWPTLRVLYTSGYAREALARDDRLETGIDLLSKPFSFSDLSARIRRALDSNSA